MYVSTGQLQSSGELRRCSAAGWGELVLCLLGVSYSGKSTGFLGCACGRQLRVLAGGNRAHPNQGQGSSPTNPREAWSHGEPRGNEKNYAGHHWQWRRTASVPKKMLPSRKGGGRATLSPTAEVFPNPKAMGKSTSPYKKRSQLEVPLPEGVTR